MELVLAKIKDAQESVASGFVRRAPREKNVLVPHPLGLRVNVLMLFVCSVSSKSSRKPVADLDLRLGGMKASHFEGCKKTRLD